MSDSLRMVAALRAALFTRLDVLFEILALRHQLGVLARADRRFRPADRLLWLCLQRYWLPWRDALVLVQPATVARWRREGFWGCWRCARRRPGRSRIDADIRVLIRRMTRENRLWGAPRIHGELLKLGITVSEGTVSRYLPDRARRPSQTWRTFLVNHFSDLTFTSSLASSGAQSDDDVVDACVRPSLLDSDVGRPPARQRSVGGRRLLSFGPTHVSGLAGCSSRPLSPRIYTPDLGQGPAKVSGLRDWP